MSTAIRCAPAQRVAVHTYSNKAQYASRPDKLWLAQPAAMLYLYLDKSLQPVSSLSIYSQTRAWCCVCQLSISAGVQQPPVEGIILYLQEKDLIRLKREAKKKGGFYVEQEAKLAFVVRIRGINDMHPKVHQRVFSARQTVQDFYCAGATSTCMYAEGQMVAV